ncbi:hypothetical protein ACJJTC_010585 [Scirpophaga incertulas]
MVPGRAWCRALLSLLLVALGAALEQYDELPALDDVVFEDDNDIDTGPPIAEKPLPLHLTKDVMLYRILKALQLQDAPRYQPASSANGPQYDENERRKGIESYAAKASVFKRFSGVYGSMNLAYRTPASVRRPQQKWKIKKGKVIGSQMVCYFKLCAFRSPA